MKTIYRVRIGGRWQECDSATEDRSGVLRYLLGGKRGNALRGEWTKSLASTSVIPPPPPKEPEPWQPRKTEEAATSPGPELSNPLDPFSPLNPLSPLNPSFDLSSPTSTPDPFAGGGGESGGGGASGTW
jgi:uncharacterized membrane protein YgcG